MKTAQETLVDFMRLSQEQRGSEVTSYLYEPDSYVPLARIDSRQLDQASKPEDNFIQSDSAITTKNVYYFHNDISGIPEELYSDSGEMAW